MQVAFINIIILKAFLHFGFKKKKTLLFLIKKEDNWKDFFQLSSILICWLSSSY